MGGVDKHDWLVWEYSVGIRGKKWYWPLFTCILDMTMVNALIIYKFVNANDKEVMSLLDFKRQVCVAYLKGADLKEATERKKSQGHLKLQLMLDLIVRNTFCKSAINNGDAKTKSAKPNQEHTAKSAMYHYA